MAVVIVRGVSKSYGSIKALEDIDLEVNEGELFTLLGPNGSGKSTLLSIIAGAEKPDRGEVRVLGHDPWSDTGALRGRVSALLDRTSIPPWYTGRDLLWLVSSLKGVEPRVFYDLAGYLGVDGYLDRPYGTYSTGTRKKLLLVAALGGGTDLVLLDEPFQGLDYESVDKTVGLLREAVEAGSTIIVATHILPPGIMEYPSRAALLDLGRIESTGSLASVAELYKRRVVAGV